MIRAAMSTDILKIADLFKSAYADWNEKILRDSFSQSRAQHFIFEKNKKILGYLCIQDNLDFMELLQICVDPQYQRQKIATQLCEAIFPLFEKPIYLEVRISNKKAICFYEKMGFFSSGIRKKYYSDGEDAVLMSFIAVAQ